MSHSNKNLGEKCNLQRKLNARNDLLLAKCKLVKDLSVEKFKVEIPNNGVKEKKYISNNKKETNGKHKSNCGSSLYNEQYGKNVENNNWCIPKTKKYSYLEKKIFKELDYKDYLRNIKIIEDNKCKKLAHRKFRIRIALLLLFFLVLILPILDLSIEKFTDGGLMGLLGLLYPTKDAAKSQGSMVLHGIDGILIKLLNIEDWGVSKAIRGSTIFFYCIPFFIFIVIFILGMIYYYKKVIKYENVKFKKRLNRK
ncbi:Plasmodium exported protein (Pm-fam-a like), unknown function [Plasmodium malariae]|uniref:Fam-l protein n=1 Tax=Plasmodium malariae TaxID=5858 RepID=A0A1A8X5D5_PLAMA|nr:Plasmodium exported protein (Pm-fam-a like), unknown function [Plasmodium malariae]